MRLADCPRDLHAFDVYRSSRVISCVRGGQVAVPSRLLHPMTQSVEQVVRKYRKTSVRVLRENSTPAKARAFLLKAGILVKHSKSAHGVRLAKQFR